MAKNDIQSAELHLNPADLGPIEITLTLGGDDKTQATVQFSAAHAATREAIETALPRLREMLQENGITLGQAGVDANNSRAADGGDRQSPGGHAAARDHAGSSAAAATAPPPAGPGARSQGRGLVDTFA
jgi:flagellar hook-length control protein FliK